MPSTLAFADSLALPSREAVTQKYGFIGRSGSGKSYAAEKLAELFIGAGAQIVVLDWVGIWWSLRLGPNGKTPGFEHVYIFGGEHGDVPLLPTSGALMADLIVDKHVSAVLDVMQFRKADRTRFATAFAEQFFHRKKTARSAVHLFIEEAQAYLPQFVRGDDARMVGVFEDIGKVGRNYGIGTSLISQRPQAINKDVLNQVEVLLAFQTNGPQERKAISGWTAENTVAGAAMIAELPTLRTGDALVWSPQWLRVSKRVHVLKRTTYDASSTPTHGQTRRVAPRRLKPADLAALGTEIEATAEKAKADDPAVLKRTVQELAGKLEKTAHALSMATTGQQALAEQVKATKAKTTPILTDADRALVGRLVKALEKHAPESADGGFATTGDGLRFLRTPIAASNKPERTAPDIVLTTGAGPIQKRAMSVDGKLPSGEVEILRAVLTYPGLERRRLSVLCGYKKSSRDAYVSRLAARGLVDVQGSTIHPTNAAEFAIDFKPLPIGRALLEHWRSTLPQGERVVMDVLAAGGAATRAAVESAVPLKKSSTNAYISRLVARGVLTVSHGQVELAEDLR
jgi:hypothetical protein